jgi:hypothetical protein
MVHNAVSTCADVGVAALGDLRSLWHGGHPVLRWNASNVAVRQDPAGNIKPDKERSHERIDGISALVERTLMRDNSPPYADGRSMLILE